jgi:hypothetical protein
VDATLAGMRTSAAIALTQTFQTAQAPTPTPTETPTPSVTPTPTPTPLTAYELLINRRGEDKSYLLLTNTGNTNLPLGDLTLQAGKVKIQGSAWGSSQLGPGACAIALKADRRGNSLPGGVNCKPVGDIVDIPNSQAGIFKDLLEVFFQGQPVGSCGLDKTSCTVSFSR